MKAFKGRGQRRNRRNGRGRRNLVGLGAWVTAAAGAVYHIDPSQPLWWVDGWGWSTSPMQGRAYGVDGVTELLAPVREDDIVGWTTVDGRRVAVSRGAGQYLSGKITEVPS